MQTEKGSGLRAASFLCGVWGELKSGVDKQGEKVYNIGVKFAYLPGVEYGCGNRKTSNLGLSVSLFLLMYFSLYVERKVPKERHLRKVPTVPSLGIYPPDQRAILPEGKMANALSSRSSP